ncbi:MAG: hypothetical protein H7287_08910, partial [Thermoleophilia bacterium]|nr:hypothetical protein [Thermoleophilia bacterium]
MTYGTTHQGINGEQLTQLLRTLYAAPNAGRADALDVAEARARELTRERLRRVRIDGRGPGRAHVQRMRIIAVAVLVAAAVSVGVALAPGGDPKIGAGRHVIAGLTDSASAAEALDWAGDVLVKSGGAAGTGTAWHGVSRAYVDGELTTVTEQWFDPSNATYTAAAWGDAKLGAERRQILQVVSIDAADTSRLRTYEKPEGAAAWKLPEGERSPSEVQELPAGYGVRQRVLATSVQEWLKVAGASPTEAELATATVRFGNLTRRSYFGGDSPEFPTDTIPKPGDDQSDPKVQARLQRAIEAGRDAQRIRPMLYLLTTVQATPQATRSLYAQIGHFETLERLPNVEVDGRVALRIRFDGVNLGTHRERVLVIDAATGAPIRTESVDRSSYTEIAR